MDSPPSYLDTCSVSGLKPKAADLSHHLSEVTKRRLPSTVKDYYRFFQIPGIGNFAGGLPNVQFFPFDTLEAKAAKPERWNPSPNYPGETGSDLVTKLASTALTSSDTSDHSHIAVPKTVDEPDPLKKIDLATALQYGTAQGYPPLLSWIRQFTREQLHPDAPYRDGPEVVLTCGSTDGFSKTLDMFVNSWDPKVHSARDRPGLLCENFLYPNVLGQSLPRGVQVVTVEADGEGMLATGPGGLEDVLSNWDDANGKRPHLMYTVTMGHNPTGIVLSMKRRREIYAACSKYDVLIVEDDPYWYLQYPSAEVEEARSRNLAHPEQRQESKTGKPTGYPFLDSMTPSFISIDTDGRVIRLDTFSKTIAPGCRLGWVTAQPDLIDRYLRITESTTQQPSGFVQSMVAELVMGPQPPAAKAAFAALRTRRARATFTGWKVDGWVRWLEGLRGAYERRMNRVCRELDSGSTLLRMGRPARGPDADWGVVTKTQLFDFAWPRGGMFVWLRMHFERHPLWHAARSPGSGSDVVDGAALSTALMLYLASKPCLVLVAPGTMFAATDRVRDEFAWAYFRLCFAAETEEMVDACSQRFVEGVQRFYRIKRVEQLEDILNNPILNASEPPAEMGNLGTWLGC